MDEQLKDNQAAACFRRRRRASFLAAVVKQLEAKLPVELYTRPDTHQ
jgi:hypothetical protein